MANTMSNDQVMQMCENAKQLGFSPERLMLLDQRLTEWSKNEITPSIAVKILRHGECAFEGSYGILGPDKGHDSLKVDSIFPICSVTKTVTAALISIMQEEGLVDLNESVRKYIPEFTGDEKSEVRIWHLLCHTSGMTDGDLRNYFDDYVKNTLGIIIPEDDDSFEEYKEAFIKIREKAGLPFMEYSEEMDINTSISIALAATPANKPHKKMSYFNLGYNLIRLIITRVSGMSMDEYATQKLFKPLKMVDSHFIFPNEKLDRYVTRGSEYIGSHWLNEHVLTSENGGGGLKSTVGDMTRFGQMFLNNGVLDGTKILSSASIRESTADHNKEIPPSVWEGVVYGSAWGLGWNVREGKKDDCGMLRSSRSFEHGGFGCTKLLCDPEYDIVAAYFTVCKEDIYWKSANFNNMVIASID